MSIDDGNSREGSCDSDQDDIESRLPEKNCLIKGKEFNFAVDKRIARGRLGGVYEVLRQSDGKRFAAKLEVCDLHFHGINMDYSVLSQATAAQCRRIAKIIDRGKIEGHFKFVVMSLLGDNLHRLRSSFIENHFSLSTALRLGIETLAALNELHNLGFVHRDVKASNYAINNGHGPLNVYIVDFGLCRSYRNAQNEIKMPREKTQFRGTTRYASLAAHREAELYPKDDLESWFYMIVEMITGNLPWSHLHRSDRCEVQKIKQESRLHENMQILLKGCPKTEFRRILKYIDGLTYHSQPDHNFISQLLQLAMKNNGLKMDDSYDWED